MRKFHDCGPHPHRRLCGASLAALAVVATSMAAPQAWAANFNVTNEAEFRAAINSANANGDTTDTITLLNNVVISGLTAFPALVNPVTVNTGAFTLSGADSPDGVTGTSLSFLGGPLFVTGAVRGGSVAGTLSNDAGGIGLSLANGSVDNSGTVTGGKGGSNTGLGTTGGVGGVGMSLANSDLINQNAIIGGAGGDVNAQTRRCRDQHLCWGRCNWPRHEWR